MSTPITNTPHSSPSAACEPDTPTPQVQQQRTHRVAQEAFSTERNPRASSLLEHQVEIHKANLNLDFEISLKEAPSEPTHSLNTSARFGHKPVVRGNHYYDPFSQKVIQLSYGSSVDPKKWQACTEALADAAIRCIESFRFQASASGSNFDPSSLQILSYQLDWRSNQIEIRFEQGVCYTLAAGTMLSDAITPFLKDPQLLKQTPSAATICYSQHTLGQTSLTPSERQLINQLAFNSSIERNLERFVAKQESRNKSHYGELSLLLALMQGVRNRGLKIDLSDEGHRKLQALLAKISKRGKRYLSWGEEKLTRSGDPWLDRTTSNLAKMISREAGAEAPLEGTLKIAAGRPLELKDSFKQLAPKLSSEQTHIDLLVQAPLHQIAGDTIVASGDRASLPLQLQVRVPPQEGKAGRWAILNSVTCLTNGQEGTAASQAHYVQFVRDDLGHWWQIDGAQAQKCRWSQVQQLAAHHGARLGFELSCVVEGRPTASSLIKDTSYDPSSLFSTQRPAVAALQLLDYGAITSSALALEWDDRDRAKEHCQALEKLRQSQAADLWSLSPRTERQQQLWEQHFAALYPRLKEVDPFSAFNPDLPPSARSLSVISDYFTQLSDPNPKELYPLPTALSYLELQQMAEVTGRRIMLLCGDQKQLEVQPTSKDEKQKEREPLYFAGFGITPEDPLAISLLTPLSAPSKRRSVEEAFDR